MPNPSVEGLSVSPYGKAGHIGVRTSEKEPIVVACTADAAYVMPLAVMLTSLVEHLSPDRALSVYVLDSGIPAADRARLSASLERPGIAINWIAAATALPDLPVWGRLSRTVYQRLAVPDLLPETVTKAIWLDCDVVVRQDVARLWDTDLGDKYVFAVQDMIVPYVSSFMGISRHAELGLPATAKYFNAGVMLVNLALWRADGVTDRVIAYLDRYRDDVVFLEQEGLNAVLAGRWGELDPRWNQNASVSGQRFYRPRHLDAATYERVVRDPWIIHFSGRIKPWTTRRPSASRAVYYRYLDQSPWRGWRPRRGVAEFLLGAYESSRLRNVLYPAEKWGVEAARRLTRRRLRRSRSRSNPVAAPVPARDGGRGS
jgi:lipopolysaccharide biosynthesis glycosyltransferase